jgi:hypothetical protein
MDNQQESGRFSDRLSDTVIYLYKDPSIVIDSFVDGIKRKYLNPYLLVAISALFLAFIVSFVISYPEMEVTAADPEQAEQISEEMEGFRLEEFQQVMEITGVIINTQFLGFLNFLLIPLLALGSMLFFRESHPGYYRHLILNAYAVGLANIAMLLMIPVWMVFQAQILTPAIHLYPAAFLIGLVLLMTYNRYLSLEEIMDWVRAFSALIIGYFFYSLIASFIVAIISFIVYMALAIGG